ncbi:MAG: phosphonate C-P lyase system protein PhnG [Paracoccaceae bacterium]
MSNSAPEDQSRKHWMGVLAKAPAPALEARWDAFGQTPAYTWLRSPEVGSVMVQGRAGGTGTPFNLGEMTVTRCALQLEGGAVGHACVQGRNKTKATQAALIDALMQTDAAPALRDAVIVPLEEVLAQARATRAGKAAATKVDFFTMVRGED